MKNAQWRSRSPESYTLPFVSKQTRLIRLKAFVSWWNSLIRSTPDFHLDYVRPIVQNYP